MPVRCETLTRVSGMQSSMVSREKSPGLPQPTPFAPIGQAVMESFGEGIVVLDAYGRMIFANQRARRVLEGLGDPAFLRGNALRERLVALGGRVRPLRQGSSELGEAIFIPDGDPTRTLAARESQVLTDTLEQSHCILDW